MEYQLRHYKIKPGTMATFKDAWLRGVYPLRKKHGFDFVGVWSNDQTNEFVWILSYGGSEGLEAADQRYYASTERKNMDPDPAQYIEPGATNVMLTVVPLPDNDGLAQGVIDHLSDLHRRLRAVIEGLDSAALDAVPKEGENSIAVLVTHTIGSELGWLHRAAGLPFERDRDAEFRARGSADKLKALIDTADQKAPELIRQALEAGTTTNRKFEDRTVTVGYCLAHTVSHGAEHVGHAELTRVLTR